MIISGCTNTELRGYLVITELTIFEEGIAKISLAKDTLSIDRYTPDISVESVLDAGILYLKNDKRFDNELVEAVLSVINWIKNIILPEYIKAGGTGIFSVGKSEICLKYTEE